MTGARGRPGMGPRALFERQHGGKKVARDGARPWGGLRRLLRRWDSDRFSVCGALAPAGGRCLDVGCGAGEFLRGAAPRFRRLVGLDISRAALADAARRTWGELPGEAARFSWVQGSGGEGLPFGDGVFDCVASLSSIQLVYDVFHFVREARRVLAPGGSFVVQVPNVAYAPRRLGLLAGRLPVTSAALNWDVAGWDGGTLRYFTLERLRRLLEDNGLRVVEARGSGLLGAARGRWPALLSADLVVRGVKEARP